MDKFYCYLPTDSADERLLDFDAKYKDNKNLQFVIVAEKQFLFDSYSRVEIIQILNYLTSQDVPSENITIALDSNTNIFSKDDWDKLYESKKFFEEYEINFGVEDWEFTWDLETVKKTNDKILNFAQMLNSHKLSPMELLSAAYIKVINREYMEPDENEHLSVSRSIYSVLNSKKIVCAGYAELFKNIILAANNPNIKIYSNNVACANDSTIKEIQDVQFVNGYHQNIIVYVKDDKYNINGYYYIDPTWDVITKKSTSLSLNFFMLPLTDIKHINVHIISNKNALPFIEPKQKTKKTDTTKTDTTKGAIKKIVESKKPIERQITYNSRKIRVSFSANDIILNDYFINDFIELYPEIYQLISEDNKIKYSNTENKIDAIERLLSIKDDANNLVNSLKSNINDEQDLLTILQDNLKKILINDNGQIFSDKFQLLRQYIEKPNSHILKSLEKKSKEISSIIDLTIPINIDKTFEEFDGDIDKLTNALNKSNNFDKLSKEICEKLKNYPEIAYCIDDNISEISNIKNTLYNKYGNKLTANTLIHALINKDKIQSLIDELEEEKKSLTMSKTPYLFDFEFRDNDLYIYKNEYVNLPEQHKKLVEDIDFYVNQINGSYKQTAKGKLEAYIYNNMDQFTNTIDIIKIQTALANVIDIVYPKISKDRKYLIVNQILKNTCVKAKNRLDSNSDNQFSTLEYFE